MIPLCSLFCFLPLALLARPITNFERADGFGAQFQTIIGCAFYAEMVNQEFVYTPFKKMEHNYDNDPDFIAKKEWLINFKNNFAPNTGYSKIPPVNVIHFFEAHLPEFMHSETLKKIKKIFRENKNIENYLNPHNFNIVVHVRRPNAHDSRIEGSNTPDSIFLKTIDTLRILYADKQPIFHIFSQGSKAQFKAFEAPDVIVHLNDSTEDAFTSMVFADALVTAASSLSYIAAMLSDGEIHYMPFWHKPLPHWKVI